jgi:hypothetical protein
MCFFEFEVLTLVTVKNTVFWDLALCSLIEVYCHVGGQSYLHLCLKGQRISKASSKLSQSASTEIYSVTSQKIGLSIMSGFSLLQGLCIQMAFYLQPKYSY